MVTEELYRCIAKVLQQSVNKKNLNDWLLNLSDYELINRDQLRQARKQAKSIKLEVFLMNCCEIINTSERKSELLAKAFKDDDCPVKGVSTDIILILFQVGKVGELLIWMIDNWETLRASESLREEASKVCPGISQDNWPLDFIYHLLKTPNSYALKKFVADVKKRFQPAESESESAAYPVKMDVEHFSDNTQPSGFETTSLRQTSLFTNLDSDGNDARDDAREHYSPSQSSERSRDFRMYTHSPIAMTTDEILKDVTSFDVCSSAGEKSMEWEVLSTPSLTGDEENAKRQRNSEDHLGRKIETEIKYPSLGDVKGSPDIGHEQRITRSEYQIKDFPLKSKGSMSAAIPTPGESQSLTVGKVTQHMLKSQQPSSLPQGQQTFSLPQEMTAGEIRSLGSVAHHIAEPLSAAKDKTADDEQQITRSEYQFKDFPLEGKGSMSADSPTPGESQSLTVAKVTQHMWKSQLSSPLPQGQQTFSLPQGKTADIEMKEISESSENSKSGEDVGKENIEAELLCDVATTKSGQDEEHSDVPDKTEPKFQDTSYDLDSKAKQRSGDNEELSPPYNLQRISLRSEVQLQITQDHGGRPNKNTIQSTRPSIPVRSIPEKTDQAESSEIHEDSSKSGAMNFTGKGIKSLQESPSKNYETGLGEPQKARKTYASVLLVNSDSFASTKTPTAMSEYKDPLAEPLHPREDDITVSENHKVSQPHQKALDGARQLSRSSSETSSASCEEPTSLDLFSCHYGKIEEYKFNLMVITKLAFPKHKTILHDWPVELIQFLSNDTDLGKNILETFLSMCNFVMEKTKPMEKEYERAGGKGLSWIRSKLKQIRSLGDPVVILYHLAWPEESVTTDTVHKQILTKAAKKEKRCLERFCDALRMIFDNEIENLSTIPKEEKSQHGDSHDDEKVVSEKESTSTSFLEKQFSIVKNTLGKRKKEKSDEKRGESIARKELITTHREQDGTVNQKTTHETAVKTDKKRESVRRKKETMKTEDSKTLRKQDSTETDRNDKQNRESAASKDLVTILKEPDGTVNQKPQHETAIKTGKKQDSVRSKRETMNMEDPKTLHEEGSTETEIPSSALPMGKESTEEVARVSEEQTKLDQATNVDDEYHDAMENLQTETTSNILAIHDSFELRAVVTDFSADRTALYIVESCWNNWHPLRMGYNREGMYYYVRLPFPHNEVEFQYKYYIHVQNYKPTWEILPYSSFAVVNRVLQLNKEIKCIYDVPVFVLRQGQMTQDVLKRDFCFHFPKTNKNADSEKKEKHSYLSLRREIFTCLKQLKSGWRTTGAGSRLLALNSQEIETILLKWLSICDGGLGEAMDQLTLLLATINLTTVLHETNHKMFEAKFLSVLSQHLSIHCFNEIHQKQLYQLIKRGFAEDSNSSPGVICEALITIYRQVKILENSPYMEWILTLPLYWLVRNEGEVKHKPVVPKRARSDVYMKSSLPEANKLSWVEIRKKCEGYNSQKALMVLSDRIHQIHDVHPWITGTYMYFLTTESLLKMLRADSKYQITKYFDLDTVLTIIMRDWKAATQKFFPIADAYSVKSILEQRFEEVLKTDAKSLSEEVKTNQKSSAENIMNLILKITNDFLKTDAYCGDKNKHTLFITNMAHLAAEWSFHLLEENESYDETRAQVSAILFMLADKISRMYLMGQDDIQFINSLLKLEWSDKELRNTWEQRIKAETSKSIRKKWQHKDQFLKFYLKEIDEYHLHGNMEECFDEYAFQCTEKLHQDLTQTGASWFNFRSNENSVKSRCGRLFGKVFRKEYDKVFQTTAPDGKLRKILNFVGKWTFIAQFYEMFYQEENVRNSMPKDVKQCAYKFVTDFRGTVKCFQDGNMKISDCEIFVEYEQPIMKLHSVLLNRDNHSGSSNVDNELQFKLSIQKKHLKSITVTRKILSDFVNLCMELEEVAVSIEDIKSMPLMKDGLICNIIDPQAQLENYESGLEKVSNFNADYLEEVKIISAVHESETFKGTWKQVVRSKFGSESDEVVTYTWEDLLTQIWPNARERIVCIITKISDGSMSIVDLIEAFDFTDGKKELVHKEMSKLCAFAILLGLNQLQKVMTERCHQVQNVLLLKKKRTSSVLLSNLIDILKLKSDFHALKFIEGNEQLTLKDINVNVSDILSDELWTNSEFVEILKEFVRQEKLIIWLKEKMKAPKEVQLFWDLAMISAGESTYEVDRASCFLSSVNAFAPLLFDLPNEAGMKEILDSCKTVWENAKSDERLRDKWRDTGCYLEWFQGIHEAHGSVGAQSLTTAQEINKQGVYFISRDGNSKMQIDNCLRLSLDRQQGNELTERKNRTRMLQDLVQGGMDERVARAAIQCKENETLNDCIMWAKENQHDEIKITHIVQSYSKESVKVMHYSDLKDLQSKLMLIAGDAEKGQHDVSRFNDVLGAVASLAQRYINLIEEGCMLFNSLTVTVQCSGDELIISLTFTKNSYPISTTSTLKDLESLVEVLDKALHRWTDYIETMRLRHYYLNDYNMRQIMYLCEKLAKSDFTDQMYSLLTNLKKQQVFQHVQEALDEATEIVEDEETTNDDSPIDDSNQSPGNLQMERKNRMVRELAKSGLTEVLAKAAVQQPKNEDVEDCAMWALENEHNETLVMESAAQFDEEAGFGPDSNHIMNYVSVLHNRTSVTLKELIMDIQTSTDEELSIYAAVNTICLSYIEKTSKLTLQDFLSIDHLGKFLGILREKLAPIGGKIARDIFPGMQKGKPNLILLPSQDMLYTTLALYAHNKKEPLPSRSEVIVCTEKTTEDEVGRFLRRAMLKNPQDEKNLFCMVSVEKLMFAVSTHIETLFNSLSTKGCADSEYQLIILCRSTEQQHYLVTCFDRSRIDLKIPAEKQKLCKYIHSKLEPDLSSIDTGHKVSVKLVKSETSGQGKSLHVKRLTEKLMRNAHTTIIRLLLDTIDVDHVLNRLHRNGSIMNEDTHLIHFDLTSAVQHGIEEFAFNLFVLGSCQDSQGRVWHHHSQHFYVIEMTESKLLTENSVLNLFPCTECMSPQQVLDKGRKHMQSDDIILMDKTEFNSATFQRPFQYLKRYGEKQDLDRFQYTEPKGSEEECIRVLLQHCGMKNPSWAQLFYFASFLNVQLINCEESDFCIGLPGLKNFAVHFMIKMAQDIATPSLDISDESGQGAEKTEEKTQEKAEEKTGLEQLQVRRKWENEAHPFAFFNEDRETMTFLNVNVTNNGDLLDACGKIVEHNMVSEELVTNIKGREDNLLGVDFNTLSRKKKFVVLCQFMNIIPPYDPDVFDPDPTYELTTDNVLKMLAIYMRLRCHIPVIIMGETGCGKTRMIEFMSKMRSGLNKDVKNMVTLKVHGGLKVADIYKSVTEAKNIAAQNNENYDLSTILFFDEANTTVAIHAIKEVVCDLTIDGEDFKDSNLQIVAACNPYKQLSRAAVEKLEKSGLGYNVKESETKHIGRIPMRKLVYRVVALPLSLQPFVWDFGQLGEVAEEIYIHQMILHLKKRIRLEEEDVELIAFVLFHVQCYMRSICKDESRYVSLRDVERSLKTYEWFDMQSKHVFKEIHDYHKRKSNQKLCDIKHVHRCLLHTLSVCYHASLDDRESFRSELSQIFLRKSVQLTESDINAEIIACQAVFASHLKMDENIACNEALRENAFLMIVCIDMRIPLFVVGKPGSSKSLACTIVADSMQGKSSHSDLYKHFKQVHILAYQCSALTDAKGIENIFNQCSQHQSKQDVNSYVAVVVLDEVGLAEDSPNMPLKVLHPLLEHGGTLNGTLTDVDPKNKIGFIGISNWALDPAKMNRGIFITRNSPNKEDLRKTAKGIFENQKNSMNLYRKDIEALTDSYLKIYGDIQGKEYFGLRDYYSLIKMLHADMKKNRTISPSCVYRAVQRNFSGGRETEKHLNIFHENLKKKRPHEYSRPPKQLTLKNMVLSNLQDGKSRFLLLLANQYSSFNLLQSVIPDFHKSVQVIFGSSFPNDHSYTEMCRNINRVKVCMEAGTTVILLNLTDINESLYDALNQHYVSLGRQKYVVLGLGGHRVKCRIADGFRLIVIELKEKVYEEYPIPLINRLEKHHLDSTSLLSEEQKGISNELTEWVKKFACIRGFQFKECDAFLGHNDDTVSSVVLSCSKDLSSYKNILLQSATADAVFRAPKGDLGTEGNDLLKIYIEEQFHDNLEFLLRHKLSQPGVTQMEIITFSNLLSDSDRTDLETSLATGHRSIMLVSLQQFQTEQDYLKKIDDFTFFCNKKLDEEEKPAILLVQCPQAHKHVQLVACAKYGLKNKLSQLSKCKCKVVIALLLSTERKLNSENNTEEEKGLSLQHTSDCQIIYVDEMRPSSRSCGQIKHFHKKSIPEVLALGRKSTEEGFNMQSLLQDCKCEALAMVKNSGNEDRNLERIKILDQLCSSSNEMGVHFVDVLTKKMIEIYADRESSNIHEDKWITLEACTAEKLQAGGSFANTLRLCLKEHVSHLLAFIISTVDRNNNLDIFCKYDGKMHNLWLEMFDACKMKWEDMHGCKEFAIKQSHYTFEQNSLRIPFCYVLAETMEEQWDAVEDLATDNESERCKIFLTNFRTSNTAMDKAVGDALQLPKSLDIIKAFGCELLKMMFNTGPEEAETLSSALEVISRRYVPSTSSASDPESLRFLLIFYAQKILQRQLKVVVDVLHICSETEEKLKEWTADLYNETDKISPVLFHQKAIEYAVEKGKEKALAIKEENSCIQWMNFMTNLKKIFNSTIDLLEETSKEDLLNKSWKPLSMLDMLFLHLLPSPSQDQFKRYLEVVSLHAKLVFKGTLKHPLHGQQFLRIVCNALRKYFEDVRLRVILSWRKKTCRICNKDCKEPTILKCGHYFCTSCLKNNLKKSEEKTCFLCHKALGSEFQPLPATLNDVQKQEVSAFQANCTSFFLEYLSHFAFVGSADDSDAPEIVQLIFDELILNDNTQKSELEKIGLNLNLATKASIFSILMSYNNNKTREVFNKQMNNQQINKDLILVALKQFDLALQQKNGSINDDKLLEECSKLLQKFERVTENQDAVLSCQTIESAAGAHHAVRQFVKIITKPSILTACNDDDEQQINIDSLVYNIKQVISGKPSVLKELFIKIGCRTLGMNWFSRILKNDSFQKLMPKSLQASSNKTVDYFTSLGDSYSMMRADLNKTSVDKHAEKVKEWFPDDQPICLKKLFAAVVWLTSHRQSKDVIDCHLSQMDDAGGYQTMLAVVINVWPLVKNSRKLSQQQISVLEQLILMTAGSVNSQSVMMSELQLLMTNSTEAAGLFWPAMPESFYFSIPEELRCENGKNAMYQCPNGHFYTIGNCTRPWTVSRCPDCQAVIGGNLHIEEAGNAKVEKLDEASQTGYKLLSSENNMQQPQDRISQQATSVIQLLIHACMLIGFANDPTSASEILPAMQEEDINEYLLKQIQKNLDDFAGSIGRNLDEAILVLFEIMSGIPDCQITDEAEMNADWKSMESRKAWERYFRANFLLPVFQNLDATIAKAQRNLNAAEDLTGLALFRLVHEVKEEEDSVSNLELQSKWWQNGHLWHFIEHPNAGHLIQCIRDHPKLQTGSVLHTILETPEIDLLQYLEDALKLQKMTIDRNQNKLDLNEAENTTLRSYQEENKKYRPIIRKYVEMWNKARIQAQSSDPNNETAEWFNEELTLDHPISTILPSSRGRGRCAKTIIRYVLEIQNRFLSKCFEIIGKRESEPEVDIPLLRPSDFVKVDKQKDLLPLIHLHTSHVVTEDAYGRHHVISYNVDALEKQARKYFVENKKLTKLESLPCIKYTQDVGIGSDWDNVIQRTKKQETLSGRLMQILDESVAQATPADICEGVRTLTHAISFLAKVDCEHDRPLHEYLQKDLLLDKNRTTMIPRSAKIHHTLALYQHLSWHKAVNFVQQGLKPYKGALDQTHQEQIKDKQVLQKITDAFQHMDVTLFQQRLNEMIVKVPDHKNDWSLKEDILPNDDFIGCDGSDDTWFDRIPEEVCFKHISHIFELAVQHVQNQK